MYVGNIFGKAKIIGAATKTPGVGILCNISKIIRTLTSRETDAKNTEQKELLHDTCPSKGREGAGSAAGVGGGNKALSTARTSGAILSICPNAF